MILGGGANHCGTTDIDQFNGGVHVKGVEIAHDQVDGRDAIGLKVCEVTWLATVREDATMNLGVEGLYTAVEHLG